MKKWFMRAGLQKRLIVSVMAVFCLPLLLIAIYILSSLTGKLRENAVSSANNILDSAAQEMTYTLSSLKDTAFFLAMDSKVCFPFPSPGRRGRGAHVFPDHQAVFHTVADSISISAQHAAAPQQFLHLLYSGCAD